MDVLFERRVSARNFKHTVVDQFSGDTLEVVDTHGSAHASGEDEKRGVKHVEKI
jgi:hypothetical protein